MLMFTKLQDSKLKRKSRSKSKTRNVLKKRKILWTNIGNIMFNIGLSVKFLGNSMIELLPDSLISSKLKEQSLEIKFVAFLVFFRFSRKLKTMARRDGKRQRKIQNWSILSRKKKLKRQWNFQKNSSKRLKLMNMHTSDPLFLYLKTFFFRSRSQQTTDKLLVSKIYTSQDIQSFLTLLEIPEIA